MHGKVGAKQVQVSGTEIGRVVDKSLKHLREKIIVPMVVQVDVEESLIGLLMVKHGTVINQIYYLVVVNS